MAKLTLVAPPVTSISDPSFVEALVAWGIFAPPGVSNPNELFPVDRQRRHAHPGLLGIYRYFPDGYTYKLFPGCIVWFEMSPREDHNTGYIAELTAIPIVWIGSGLPNYSKYYLSARCPTDSNPGNNNGTNVTMYSITFSDRGSAQVNVTINEVPFGSIARPGAALRVNGHAISDGVAITH